MVHSHCCWLPSQYKTISTQNCLYHQTRPVCLLTICVLILFPLSQDSIFVFKNHLNVSFSILLCNSPATKIRIALVKFYDINFFLQGEKLPFRRHVASYSIYFLHKSSVNKKSNAINFLLASARMFKSFTCRTAVVSII